MSVSITPFAVDLEHITLAGLRFGEGKHPVLCVHGWLDNAMSFAPLAEVLCAQDISLYALELAGHGHSAHRPQGVGYHFFDYLRDVLFSCDALRFEKIDIIAHSLGAAISTCLAGSFPERVRSFVALDLYGVPWTSDEQALPDRVHDKLYALDYMHCYSTKIRHDFARIIEARCRLTPMHPENAALLIKRNMRKCEGGLQFVSDPRLQYWQPDVMSEAQILSFITRIQASVCVIQASEGYAAANEAMAKRYAATQDIRVLTLPGHHHLHMDEALAVGNGILRFWQEKGLA